MGSASEAADDIVEQTTVWETGPITRHDVALAAIPACYSVAVLVGAANGLSLEASLAIGSLGGVAVVVDSLFVHPPNG